jgi:hypothetical protein
MRAENTSIIDIAGGDSDSIQAVLEIATNRSTVATLISFVDGDIPRGVDVIALDQRCASMVEKLKGVSIFRLPEGDAPSHAILLEWHATGDRLDKVAARHTETTGQPAIAISFFSKGERDGRHLFDEREAADLQRALEDEEHRNSIVAMDSLASATIVAKILQSIEKAEEKIFDHFEIELVLSGGVDDSAKKRVADVMSSIGMKTADDFVANMNKVGRLDKDGDGCLCTVYHVKTPEGREAIVHACQTIPVMAFSVFASRELGYDKPYGVVVQVIERDGADKYLREGVNLYTIKE